MIIAILQARCSSSRFPQKVLKPILSKAMLWHQIERIKRSKKIDQIILATSTEASDDPLKEIANDCNVTLFRGDLHDVLDRYYQAAKSYPSEHILRITGDCPLIDPHIIDSFITFYLDGKYDFATNTVHPSFPDGLDLWAFPFSHLEQAWQESILPSEREHVTQYFINNPQTFKTGHFKRKEDLSFLRWTVDEEIDFQVINSIFTELYPSNPSFTTNDILNFLEKKPTLRTLNKNFERDEGLKKSKSEDEKKKTPSISKKLNSLQEKGKRVIPGMTQLLSKRPDQFSYGVWPTYYKKAKGVTIWDFDDNKFIDMSIGGIGATIFGYADPEIDQAVIKAITNGVACSLNSPDEIILAEMLIEDHPWAQMVRYAKTGGEAMAIAIRLARSSTGKEKIAFCGYHGWHDWYLSANLNSGDDLKDHLLPGLDPSGVPQGLKNTTIPFQYNNFEQLEKLKNYGPELAAIVMEPIRNLYPKDGFLQKVRKIATELGIPLIFDEISSGYRLTVGGAHKLFDIKPDIAVFSKALGNGYPISAIIGQENVMKEAQRSFISSTGWTERTGLAAAIAVIKKFRREKTHLHLKEIGEKVQSGWKYLGEKYDIKMKIGGIPPLGHFSFPKENQGVLKAYFVQELISRGILGSNTFYAMGAHKPWHVKAYLTACDEIFENIKDLNTSEIEKKLRGLPAKSGFKRLN
ncbi:aminotransferase class III-fold pyridoxal phosphate-dependent enzyme [Bacteriovoracales bacterium]|nr:aminotransferase class III-fold pyridoxal phosphate-dependent enzyme [Bacteriovoracales bacterium]